MLRRIGVRFRPYRWQIACSALMVTVTAVLNTLAPLMLQRIIDHALPRHDVRLLVVLCGLMMGAGVLASVIMIGQSALIYRIAQGVSARLRIDVYDRVRAQPLHFYSERGQAQIQTRLISDIDGVDQFLSGTVQQILAALTTLAAVGTAMVILSWQLAVACLLMASILSLLNNRFARRRRALARVRQGLLTKVLRYVAEDLSWSGVLLGRTMRRTGKQRERFAKTAEHIRDVTFRQRMAGISAYALIGTSFACVPPLIFLASGTIGSGISVGAVVVLVMLQTRLARPIQGLLRLSGSIQTSVAMFERVLEYLDLDTDDHLLLPNSAPVPTGPAHIRLRGVSYCYPEAAEPALTHVDADFTPGSVTVVTGRTGSGKSTLALVLAGLIAPDIGSVQLNDDSGPAGLRAVVTLVAQHTALQHGTVRDNVAFACDDLTQDDLDRVLAAAQLETVVARLPEAADTSIGAEGFRLSGGERQRLGVARALLTRCQVMIADEATSSLDHATADHIHAVLRRHCRDKTLVIIAHRLPRMEPDDRVIVLDHGRVVEAGTHAVLRDAEGPYSGLLKAQYREMPGVSATS
ncbi:ABC transporter ATP-binding protein [Streptomyces sp. NPDC058985]|uniref:ABC transporter ATP-binding protein n=1 Tax=Streptomyces sp. NPDC058985 TaxID=3346684 RepID=UPI003697697A